MSKLEVLRCRVTLYRTGTVDPLRLLLLGINKKIRRRPRDSRLDSSPLPISNPQVRLFLLLNARAQTKVVMEHQVEATTPHSNSKEETLRRCTLNRSG
jgi:hypothetical protein